MNARPANIRRTPRRLLSSGAVLSALACAFSSIAAAQTAVQSPSIDGALPSVVVRGRTSATQQGALRDAVIKTESINAHEMASTGATNLPELLAHRPGIDVQVECSVCNVRNITLNNLPGRFTTLLQDGVPIFSSVSSAYGLDMIGLNGLERVDIARGAGASLTAPESLAGTVNLVTKRPTRDMAEIDVGGGGDGFRRAALYGAKTFDGGAVAVSGTSQRHDSVDGTGAGISQYGGYDRQLAGFSLFLDDAGGFRIKSRIDHVDEKRIGGPLGNDYAAVRLDTSGNPFDFSKGPHGSPVANSWINPLDGTLMPAYHDGRFGLAQIIFTRRDQFVATAERQFGDYKLHLGVGYADHRQDSWYGGDATYFGKQKQYHLDASLLVPVGAARVTAGVDYRHEDLHSRATSLDPSSPTFGIERADTDAYVYRTPALFMQVDQAFFEQRLEASASLRQDHNNVYGDITTPRLNLLYHHSDSISSRFAVGTGFRLPTSFFELEHAVLTAPAVDRSQAVPEKSNNLSYAWSYAGDRLALTASVNHTRISNMALFVDDTANSGNFLLRPSASAYTINNADLVGTWQATPADALTIAIERYQYRFNAGDFQGSLFARPDAKLSVALEHEAGPWDVHAGATYTGQQNLASFYDYAHNPRYNLDGTAKPDRSPGFWVVDARLAYQWNRTVSTYFGVNNLFDYQQAKQDGYLWVDAKGALDVTYIWGPNLGRSLYAGIKLTY